MWLTAYRLFARPFREVLDEEEPALAGTDYIEIAVAVDIDHGNLHAGADPAAVLDDVPHPLAGRPGGRQA